MGMAFSNLTVNCLMNVEGGFGEKVSFEGDAVEAAFSFEKFILEASPRITFDKIS
jgi:hypothetical protein